MEIRSLVVGVLVLLLGAAPAWSQPIERQNKIFFSNIAPGELENDLIKNFPVKIVLQSESGKFYGGAYVRVFNASGIAIFKKMCEKPWLFMKLPEGDYNVVAVDRNKVTRVKAFTVKKQPEEGVKRTVVKLTWPKNVAGRRP
jgi:hypothetical protein